MATLSNEIADKFVGHAVDLSRYEEDVRRRVLYHLKKLEKELAEGISSGLGTAYTQARLSSLQKQTKATIATAYRGANEALQSSVKDLARTEQMFFNNSVNSAIGANLLTTTLSPNLLKNITSKNMIFGAPSSRWWGEQSKTLQTRFMNEMRMGISKGEPLGKLVQRVRGKATGQRNIYYDAAGKKQTFVEFKGGIMDTSTRHANALVRTSVQTVSGDVRKEMIDANDDVIKGKQWLSTLDKRTTPICRAFDGLTWDLADKPIGHNKDFAGGPPIHWQCRSTTLPVLKSWEELSQGSPELKKKIRKIESKFKPSTRAAVGKPVSANMEYTEWFKRQPEAVKLDILGPGKLRLFNQGNLNFRQMVDQSGNPLTMGQLAAKYNLTTTTGLPAEIEAIMSARQLAAYKKPYIMNKKGWKTANKAELQLADDLGGTWIDGNRPFDLFLDNEFIEHKAVLRNERGLKHQIDVSKGAKRRKQTFQSKYKVRGHTVATIFDETSSLYGRMYYKKGVGSFRLEAMTEVKDIAHLKKMLKKGSRSADPPVIRVKLKGHKTLQEAQDWAENNLTPVADFDELDVGLANQFNEYAAGAFERLGVKPRRILFDEKLFDNTNQLGKAFENGTVAFNPKAFRTVDELKELMEQQFAVNRFTTDSVGHVFRHEAGHLKYFETGGTEATAARKLSKKHTEELNKAIGPQNYSKHLSEYARASEGEFYAEMKALEMAGQRVHPVAKKVVNDIERQLKKSGAKAVKKVDTAGLKAKKVKPVKDIVPKGPAQKTLSAMEEHWQLGSP